MYYCMYIDLRCVKHQLSAMGVGGLEGVRPLASMSFGGDSAIPGTYTNDPAWKREISKNRCFCRS